MASERDVIERRVNCDLCDVYVHRSTATPTQARELFLDVLRRVNKLAKEPEFYDTLTNNCTTNIRSHINHLKPDRGPLRLPGSAARLLRPPGLRPWADRASRLVRRDPPACPGQLRRLSVSRRIRISRRRFGWPPRRQEMSGSGNLSLREWRIYRISPRRRVLAILGGRGSMMVGCPPGGIS